MSGASGVRGDRAAAPVRGRGGRAGSRLGAALALELRVQWRYGIIPVGAALATMWTVALAAMPAPMAAAVTPFLLFVDTAAFGVMLVAGLLLFERTEGARAALAVTPIRAGEYLAAKLGTLAALSTLCAVPIALVATRGHPGGTPAVPAVLTMLAVLPPTLLGTLLATLVFLAMSVAVAARVADLSRALVLLPLPAIPLIVVPLGYLSGPLDHPAALVVPTTIAVELMRAGIAPESGPFSAGALTAATLYLAAFGAALVAVALRQLHAGHTRPPRERAETAGAGVPREPGTMPAASEPARPSGGVLAALLLIDLRGVGRDLVLAAAVAGPVLLALVLRYGYPPVAAYARTRYGFDPAPYEPLMLAMFVLLHVPMMVGAVGALRVMEDADDRTLAVLRVSPASLNGYLGYRLLMGALGSLAALAVAVPLSGLAPGGRGPALAVAVALAALQAPLFTLAVTAMAGNKVEALAALKLMGSVTLLPAAMWFLPGPAGWLLAWLPPFWPVRALWGDLWGDTAVLLPASVVVGALLSLAVGGVLWRRTVRRVESGY